MVPKGQYETCGTVRAPRSSEHDASLHPSRSSTVSDISTHMAVHQHFQRLKHIYTSNASESADKHVAIAYGRAMLNTRLGGAKGTVGAQRSHHRLLRDVAFLAAASLEKEHLVDAEQFVVDVHDPDYEGPVVAAAEVVLAEPPRIIVIATLRDEEGTLIADAFGLFRPSTVVLPPDPLPEQEDNAVPPPPAMFMPIHMTPVGLVCLN